MRQKAIQGGTPGRAPLGHLNERRFDDGREIRTITADPERAEQVTWVFHACPGGEWGITRLAAEAKATQPGRLHRDLPRPEPEQIRAELNEPFASITQP